VCNNFIEAMGNLILKLTMQGLLSNNRYSFSDISNTFTAHANYTPMKKYFLLLVVLTALFSVAHAQQPDTTQAQLAAKTKNSKPGKRPACYIGLSTGINNPSGYIGLDFNIHIGKYITLDAGAGPGTWGNKLYIGGKYYLKKHQRGWALSGGVTFSSGLETVNLKLPTIYNNTERVALTLKPESNAFIAVYHYWKLGKKNNRFFVDFGKSVALQPERFHQKTGDPITEEARQRVSNLCPGKFLGGLMVGTGFSFGLYHK